MTLATRSDETVTGADADDCGPVPIAFLAATLNVYAVPFVRPAIVCEVAAELKVTGVLAVAPVEGVTM